jgi:MFS family permease
MLTIGPMIMAVGMVLLASIQPGQSYWMLVFPGFVVFAIGLVFVVAPVTATALSDVGPAESGTASGINNAVARIGGLVAIILIPLAGGLAASQADALGTGEEILAGYRTSMLIAAGVCVVGALLALIAFRSEDGRARIPTA